MTALPILPPPSVSELFAARQREHATHAQGERAERRLRSALHLLHQPFSAAWVRAGEMVAFERSMGLRPEQRTVTGIELNRHAGLILDQASKGTHVTVTEHGERAVMIVSVEEYDRLLLDRRLLRWESTDG